MYTISYGVGTSEQESDIRKQKIGCYAGCNDNDHWMFNEDRD